MKIFKHRNILGLIFGLMALIPLVSIGVKCAYATVNKNAYQSYSGEQSISEDFITNRNQLTQNTNNYTYFQLANNHTQRSGNIELNVYINNVEIIESNLSINLTNIDRINITQYGLNCLVYLYEGDNYSSGFNSNANTLVLKGIITGVNSYTIFEDFTTYNYGFYILDQTNNSYIDNVFEYAIDDITKNSNLGNVRFFTWFASMFLDLNNAINMLYIGFVNWYFNYLLLVSLGYVLFAVLMWFINYIRRLLEKGQDFGQGGY